MCVSCYLPCGAAPTLISSTSAAQSSSLGVWDLEHVVLALGQAQFRWQNLVYLLNANKTRWTLKTTRIFSWIPLKVFPLTLPIGNVQLFVNLTFILYARWRIKTVCLQTKLISLAIRKKSNFCRFSTSIFNRRCSLCSQKSNFYGLCTSILAQT